MAFSWVKTNIFADIDSINKKFRHKNKDLKSSKINNDNNKIGTFERTF